MYSKIIRFKLMGERDCIKMKMFIMNQWLGITEMREDAKMARRKTHSAGCVFAKLRGDMNSVKTNSKNTT